MIMVVESYLGRIGCLLLREYRLMLTWICLFLIMSRTHNQSSCTINCNGVSGNTVCNNCCIVQKKAG